MGDGGTFFINAELDVDNLEYFVTFSVNDEDRMVFSDEDAIRWAQAITTALTDAEYEAAIFRQMNRLGVRIESTTALVADLRSQQPEVQPGPLGIWMRGATNNEGKAFIQVMRLQDSFGQMDPEAARAHVAGVLESMAIAKRDTTYLRTLVNKAGMNLGSATQSVAAVGMYRESRGEA